MKYTQKFMFELKTLKTELKVAKRAQQEGDGKNEDEELEEEEKEEEEEEEEEEEGKDNGLGKPDVG